MDLKHCCSIFNTLDLSECVLYRINIYCIIGILPQVAFSPTLLAP